MSAERRDIPAHDKAIFGPKRHACLLVIPVLDEGARITAQLARLKALAPPLDIVIADAGSSDGALAPDLLKPVPVRALLVKTGPGRLSAQLRMAYGWALDEGYDGIITADGNDKDNMTALPRFIEALESGCDYAQGSRYIAGGNAINTPLERHIANRLIHAPLISLAAGRRYTDTTNGFRAYSSRYLRDARVQPFRAVFEGYALLFYLSIRAAQLGYQTCEIPVERRYPESGPAPTKISGLAGRFAMLGELIKAVTGGYNP